jgi:hypothetical protein
MKFQVITFYSETPELLQDQVNNFLDKKAEDVQTIQFYSGTGSGNQRYNFQCSITYTETVKP